MGKRGQKKRQNTWLKGFKLFDDCLSPHPPTCETAAMKRDGDRTLPVMPLKNQLPGGA